MKKQGKVEKYSYDFLEMCNTNRKIIRKNEKKETHDNNNEIIFSEKNILLKKRSLTKNIIQIPRNKILINNILQNKKAMLISIMTGIAGISNANTTINTEDIEDSKKNYVDENFSNSFSDTLDNKNYDVMDRKLFSEVTDNKAITSSYDNINIDEDNFKEPSSTTFKENNKKINFTFNGIYYSSLNSHKSNDNSLNSSGGTMTTNTVTTTTTGQSYVTTTTTESFNVSETQLRQSTILMSWHTPGLNAGDDNYWDTVVSLGGQKIPYVIINPFNGPANAVDPRYVAQIDRNLGAGIKNLAYVYTDRFTRSYTDLFSDIDKYVQFYGQNKIAGIFLDELVAGRSNAANNTYMKTAYDYIKNKYPHMIVVGNPAAPINDDLAQYADIWLTSEVTANDYINNYTTPTSTFENDPSNFNRIMHVVHTANPSEYEKILQLSRERNAGWIMITSDVQWNPYNELPINFADIETKINTPVILQTVVSPNGTVTTQTVTPGGTSTITTTTTNNGIGQLEMPRSKLDLDLTKNTRSTAYKNILNTNDDEINIDLTYLGNFSTDYNDKKSGIGYTSKSNGIVITGAKDFGKFTLGSVFGYQSSKVDYKDRFDPISEKIDSFQFGLNGKYEFNDNVDLMGALTYSVNKHKFETETGLGTMQDAKYNSKVLNFDTRLGYKYFFGNSDINGYIKPYIGLGITRVNEGAIDKLNIGKASKTGFDRIVGIYSQVSIGKFDIYGNVEYEDRKNDNSYHAKRSYSSSYEIAPLYYSRGNFGIELGVDYNINELFKVGLGYKLTDSKNSNFMLGIQASF